MAAIANRYDFVFIFDVRNGNPNGDPDAGNLPRLDPETGRGLVTDVALKRKVRNYVALARPREERYGIYMRDGAVLNAEHRKAYDHFGIQPDTKSKKAPKDKAQELTRWMCTNYFDIRTFGAVMSTEVNCGQVRGPVQMTFAQSHDPVVPMEVTITRSSVTKEDDARKNEREMGRKHIVPYGLYRTHGFISARLANDPEKGTGFSGEDLDLFWKALRNMFDHDRSAARGEMTARGLIVFEHASDLGNAPAHKLFERVTVKRTNSTTITNGTNGAELHPPRSFEDYEVDVEEAALPSGIAVQRLI